MYAVVKTGGKQYRVAKGDIIEVEKLEVEAGKTVTLDQVLMVGGNGVAKIGSPMLDGASVKAEVLNQKKGKKVIIFKTRPRSTYRRKNGHRQNITVLKITDIKG